MSSDIITFALLCWLAIATTAWGRTPLSEQFERGMQLAMDISQVSHIHDSHQSEANTRSDFVIPHPVFSCRTEKTPQNHKKAKTVHELTPYDIALVGALGDSVTAGYGLGASNLSEVALNNRGESWSVGGDGDNITGQVITLPNILRMFNPRLKGFSVGVGLAESENAGLNRAVGGSTNRNMLDQAMDLVTVLTTDKRYKMKDWKLVTIMIGGNDLCAACIYPELFGPTAYIAGIRAALDYLHSNLPNALVQVVSMFDISPLPEMSTGPTCDNLQSYYCVCVTDPAARANTRDMQQEYWRLLEELISSGVYDSKDDFSVVLQPHLKNITPPKDSDGNYIKEFFSYDCFHPSRPAHQLFALALWDSMLQKVGAKVILGDLDESNPWQISCPTEDKPFIFTNVNSRVSGGTQ